MKRQQKTVLSIIAILDILIAAAIFATIMIMGSAMPILVPIALLATGCALLLIVFTQKS
ncbi:MAG: hypothetical protein HKN33_15850 [Pyrinomonadaceae bacterium]|nr:hypothetical protein [Pyrinomonadaceae bacterium]